MLIVLLLHQAFITDCGTGAKVLLASYIVFLLIVISSELGSCWIKNVVSLLRGLFAR